MPGKVNPSIPEMVNQVCFQVIGCDATITAAAEAGQLELNVMMPVIAWNALHACTILTQALVVLRSRTIDGIAADRGTLPRAARSQHRQSPRRSARTSGTRRPRRSRRSRCGLAARSASSCSRAGCSPPARLDAILSPEAMTRRGYRAEDRSVDGQAHAPRRGRAAVGVRIRARRRDSAASAPASALGRSRIAPRAPPVATSVAQEQPRHGRLFPPEELGELEGPDRDAWQMPDAVMDALRIADGSHVADIGAGGGWFTVRLARRVGPNGVVYAQDVQAQMLEAIRAARPSRGAAQRARGPWRRRRSAAARDSVEAVLIVDAYHEFTNPWRGCPTCGRPEARRPPRRRGFQQGRRRPGAADGRTGGRSAGDRGGEGGGADAAAEGDVPAVPVLPGVRDGREDAVRRRRRPRPVSRQSAGQQRGGDANLHDVCAARTG